VFMVMTMTTEFSWVDLARPRPREELVAGQVFVELFVEKIYCR
jgi:hypothetical protein